MRRRLLIAFAALVVFSVGLGLTLRPPDRIAQARALIPEGRLTMERLNPTARWRRDPLRMRDFVYDCSDPPTILTARARATLLPQGWTELSGSGGSRFFVRLDSPLVQALLGTSLGHPARIGGLPLRGSVSVHIRP